MVGIRRNEILEGNDILESVTITKELRKTEVSFNIYYVPKTVLGGFFCFLYVTKERVLFQEGRESCKNEVLMINWKYS